jgi:hypothetical protein
MTLTHEQKQYVKTLIWRKVKYQETFEEVYDHILTALEDHEESELPFDLLVLKVINESFGSFKSLRDKEKQRLNIVSTQMGEKYNECILFLIKPPGVLILLAASSILFYLFVGNKAYIALDVFPMVMSLLPIVLINMRHLFRVYKGKKRSIASMVVNIHAFTYFSIQVTKAVTKHKNDFHIMSPLSAAAGSLMVTFFMIFLISFVWIYYSEFKMKLVS